VWVETLQPMGNARPGPRLVGASQRLWNVSVSRSGNRSGGVLPRWRLRSVAPRSQAVPQGQGLPAQDFNPGRGRGRAERGRSAHPALNFPRAIVNSPRSIVSSPWSIANFPWSGLNFPWPIVNSAWSIASSPWSIASSPWSIASSPWSIASSPWSIASSPWSIANFPWSIVNSAWSGRNSAWGNLDSSWAGRNSAWGDLDSDWGGRNSAWGDLDSDWGGLNPDWGKLNPAWGIVDPDQGRFDLQRARFEIQVRGLPHPGINPWATRRCPCRGIPTIPPPGGPGVAPPCGRRHVASGFNPYLYTHPGAVCCRPFGAGVFPSL